MENRLDVLLLSDEDLMISGCCDFKRALKVTEDALVDFGNNKILFPDKVSQVFDDKSQNRINCLPATLLEKKICGMKWVSVFPNNPKNIGKQNVSAAILLSEIESGFPIVFMEGTLCSNLRTASVSAIAAKYLARKDSKVIGIIGAGEQAKCNFLAIKTMFPEINVCKIASRTEKTEKNFINELSRLFTDVKFVQCNSEYEKAVIDADIIITAISGQSPILKAEWIKRGAFYCHIGGLEDDYAVPLSANKIVCDDWEAVKHRTQTISRLYSMGKLSDEDIYGNLFEIVNQTKKGRESDSEFIYFNAVGLSYVDVALAYDMYKRANLNNRGIHWCMQHKKMFEHNTENFIL